MIEQADAAFTCQLAREYVRTVYTDMEAAGVNSAPAALLCRRAERKLYQQVQRSQELGLIRSKGNYTAPLSPTQFFTSSGDQSECKYLVIPSDEEFEEILKETEEYGYPRGRMIRIIRSRFLGGDEIVAAARSMHKQGMSYDEIITELGISPSRANQVLDAKEFLVRTVPKRKESTVRSKILIESVDQIHQALDVVEITGTEDVSPVSIDDAVSDLRSARSRITSLIKQLERGNSK